MEPLLSAYVSMRQLILQCRLILATLHIDVHTLSSCIQMGMILCTLCGSLQDPQATYLIVRDGTSTHIPLLEVEPLLVDKSGQDEQLFD